MNTVVSVASVASASPISAAALTTTTLPPIADTATNADAELLALGARLEPIIAEWIAEMRIDEQQQEAHDAACLGADLPFVHVNSVSFDEFQERNLARSMVQYIGKDNADADLDEHGSSIKWPRIHGQMYPLCDDILSRRVTTARGLGVQVRAASIYFEALWDSYGEDDEDIATAQRSFIESVARFSGVVPVPVEAAACSGAPIPSRALKVPETDPIFAAIERHKTAWAAESDACLVADRLAPLGNKPAGPGYRQAEAEYKRTNEEVEEAVSALIDTSPTTIAGTVALLRHVVEFDGLDTFDHDDEDGNSRPWTYWISSNVADALEKMDVTA